MGAVAGTALRQQLRVHSSCQPCQAMQAHDACLSPRHQPATRLQVGAEAHLEEGGGVRRVPHPGDGTGSWAGGGGGLSHLVQGFQLQAVEAQLCLPLLFVHAAHGLTAGEVLEAAL